MTPKWSSRTRSDQQIYQLLRLSDHLGRMTGQAPYSLWGMDAGAPEFLSQEKYRSHLWRQDQQITIR